MALNRFIWLKKANRKFSSQITANSQLLINGGVFMQWYLVLAFLFVLSVTVFAIQNSQQVSLQFLYWELPPFPLVMLILFSAAAGVLVTLLFSVAKQLKSTMQIRDLQSRVRQMEKKLADQPAPRGDAHGPSQDGRPDCKL